jgi:hypothetical protein
LGFDLNISRCYFAHHKYHVTSSNFKRLNLLAGGKHRFYSPSIPNPFTLFRPFAGWQSDRYRLKQQEKPVGDGARIGHASSSGKCLSPATRHFLEEDSIRLQYVSLLLLAIDGPTRNLAKNSPVSLLFRWLNTMHSEFPSSR